MPPITDPASVRVSELKTLLRQKELPVTGAKAELVARLDEFDPTRGWLKEIEILLTDENSEETEQSEDGASNLIIREMELCRREKEVAELELRLMRQQLNNLRSANNQQNTIDSNVQNNRERVNLSELKDLVNIFDGGDGNYANWEKQVKYVKTVYNLSEKRCF